MKKSKVKFNGKVFDRYGKELVKGTPIAMVPNSQDYIQDFLYLGAYQTIGSNGEQRIWLEYLTEGYIVALRRYGIVYRDKLLLSINNKDNIDKDIQCPQVILVDDPEKTYFWQQAFQEIEDKLEKL